MSTSTLRFASLTVAPKHLAAHVAMWKSGKCDPAKWIRGTLTAHGVTDPFFIEGHDPAGGFWGFYWRPGSALPSAMPAETRAKFDVYIEAEAIKQRKRLRASDLN